MSLGFPTEPPKVLHTFPRLGKTAVVVPRIQILDSSIPSQRRESAALQASPQPAVWFLHGGIFPPRSAVCACFSYVFLASVPFTWQRVPKPAEGVLKLSATCSMPSLQCFTYAVFLGAAFLVLRKTGDLHSNVIKSLPEALNSSTWPGQAAACLLCFRWWQNRVEEDRAEELTIHSQIPTSPISKYFRADIKTAKKEEILS